MGFVQTHLPVKLVPVRRCVQYFLRRFCSSGAPRTVSHSCLLGSKNQAKVYEERAAYSLGLTTKPARAACLFADGTIQSDFRMKILASDALHKFGQTVLLAPQRFDDNTT